MIDKKMMLAIVLSMVVLIGFQFLYPADETYKKTAATETVSKAKPDAKKEIQAVKPVSLDSQMFVKSYHLFIEDKLVKRELKAERGVSFANYQLKNYQKQDQLINLVS